MKNMKSMKNLLFTLLLISTFLLTVFPRPVYAGNVTWFFRQDYTLKTVNTNVATMVYVSGSSGSYPGFLGFRIYLDTVELTNGISAVVSRTSAGEGVQTVTFPASTFRVQFNVSRVKVEVYMKIGNFSWTKKAEFYSDRLQYKSIGGTWTFRVYTKLYSYTLYGTVFTYFEFYFGSSSYNSRIENVELGEPDVYDIMFYLLRTGNFVGFIVYPYVSLIGNLFYGLMTLLICLPLYIRYRNIAVILFVMILLGGAGGVISLLIPESGLQLAWLIFVLGLAGLLYKVFR